jgi:hypothetical protein
LTNLPITTAEHHIDNPGELKVFVETQTKGAICKVVSIQRQDLDKIPNVNPILKIKSNFEYVWLPNDTRGTKNNSFFLVYLTSSNLKECTITGSYHVIVQGVETQAKEIVSMLKLLGNGFPEHKNTLALDLSK